MGVLTARYSSDVVWVVARRRVICSGSSVSRASQTVSRPARQPAHSFGGRASRAPQAGRPADLRRRQLQRLPRARRGRSRLDPGARRQLREAVGPSGVRVADDARPGRPVGPKKSTPWRCAWAGPGRGTTSAPATSSERRTVHGRGERLRDHGRRRRRRRDRERRREQRADHERWTREPPTIRSVPSASRTSALPLPS